MWLESNLVFVSNSANPRKQSTSVFIAWRFHTLIERNFDKRIIHHNFFLLVYVVREKSLGNKSFPNYLNGNRYAKVHPVRFPQGHKPPYGWSPSKTLLMCKSSMGIGLFCPKRSQSQGHSWKLCVVCMHQTCTVKHADFSSSALWMPEMETEFFKSTS